MECSKKKNTKKIASKSRSFIYSILILLPSLLTGGVYSAVDNSQSAESLISNLSAITTSLATSLSDTQNYTSYRVRLLLSHSAFTSFDIAGMGKLSSEFLYYSPNVQNIYIMDTSKNVVYGTNDTVLSQVDNTSHIDSASKGFMGFYSTFYDGDPFSQFALPIYSSDETPQVLGIIVMTYNFDALEEYFKGLNSSSVDLNAYIFDEYGRTLTASSNQAYKYSNQTIDIGNIKQGIDYAPTTPFILFDDIPVLGTVHTITDTDWTVLLTSTAPEDKSDLSTQLLSVVSGFFGLGGISVLENLRKRKLSLSELIMPEDILDDSLAGTSNPLEGASDSSSKPV